MIFPIKNRVIPNVAWNAVGSSSVLFKCDQLLESNVEGAIIPHHRPSMSQGMGLCGSIHLVCPIATYPLVGGGDNINRCSCLLRLSNGLTLRVDY